MVSPWDQTKYGEPTWPTSDSDMVAMSKIQADQAERDEPAPACVRGDLILAELTPTSMVFRTVRDFSAT